MTCLICNEPTKYFFHKNFDRYGLDRVDYHKCSSCGFVYSETHRLLSESSWSELNYACHSSYQGGDENKDDPRWLERLKAQADVLSDTAELGLVAIEGDWLDYACGDGKLSELLRGKKNLLKYDKFMHSSGYLNAAQLNQKTELFNFVITTSVFEHLIQRQHYDDIHSLVSEKGVMGLHTLICEDVPCDKNWFYLLPVHCAFHTNKSMSILMKQWGFVESIYNVDARLWLSLIHI